MIRIAWMIERRIPWGKDWIPFKIAGKEGGYVTRASARREAVLLNAEDARRGDHRRRLKAWEYRAHAYLPRLSRTSGKRRP